jgi:hypothetical protein
LEFNGFSKLTRLLGGSSLDLVHNLSDGRSADFAI